MALIGYPGALFSPTCVTNEYVNVQADHAIAARNISREAITLLKNDDNMLPLSVDATLKIFGQDAQNNPNGINSCSGKACDTGVLGMGWGSGKSNPAIECSGDTYTSRNGKLSISGCAN
jgi:beta-glucosidase